MKANAANYTAIILAAGKGERLGVVTKETPKPLLAVGKITLLEHALLFIRALGIKKVIVAARYQYEKLAAAVSDYNQRHNEQVQVVKVGYGTLNSFAGALPEVLDGNILVRDSDYIFSKSTLEAVAKNLDNTGMFCSYDLSGDAEDVMKAKTDGAGNMAAASKTLADFDAIYTGIFILATEDLPEVMAIIKDQFSKKPEEKEKIRVEVIFDELVSRGRKVKVKDVGTKDWVEVDTPEELDKARETIKQRPEIYEL